MTKREILLRLADELVLYGHALSWVVGIVAVLLAMIYQPWYIAYAVFWLAMHLALSKEGCPFVMIGKHIKKKLMEKK